RVWAQGVPGRHDCAREAEIGGGCGGEPGQAEAAAARGSGPRRRKGDGPGWRPRRQAPRSRPRREAGAGLTHIT
ncbi:hypothetical protein E2562_030242, partial [Oryza meyeriana var. granulata]